MKVIDEVDPEDTFERFYRRHEGTVRAHARRLSVANVDADDIFSATMLVAWRRFPEIPSDPGAWLHGVARMCARNAHRRSKTYARVVDRLTGDRSLHVVWDETDGGVSEVVKVLSELRPADREVLLAAVTIPPGTTLAAWLGLSSPAARQRLARARRRLRMLYDDGASVGGNAASAAPMDV